jgi:hypothetical protein
LRHRFLRIKERLEKPSRPVWVALILAGAAFLVAEYLICKGKIGGSTDQRLQISFFAVSISLVLTAIDISLGNRSPLAIAAVYLAVVGAAIVEPGLTGALSGGLVEFAAIIVFGGVMFGLVGFAIAGLLGRQMGSNAEGDET